MQTNLTRAPVTRAWRQIALWLSPLCVLLALLLGSSVQATETELAEEDQACQECHGATDIEPKKTGAGELLSLHISTDAFLASRHSDTSCTDCHEDADDKNHGKTPLSIESKREYRLSYQDACTTCHKKNVATFKDSVHAYLVAAGDEKAPTCSDCHNSHTQIDIKIVQPIANVPCASCHEEIFDAYAADVHGLERVAQGKPAPLCADCHSSHKILAASLGDSIKETCLSCHEDTAARHESWLPNSARHFDAVSCVACHAPDAQRRVNLRVVDGYGQPQVQEAHGAPQFERLIQAVNTSGGSLNEKELRNFLRAFNAEHGTGKAMLSGRLEVRSGVQAHQLSVKEEALKDCGVCHQAGSAHFQSVVLTMAGPDGRPLRQDIEKDVLNSATAIGLLRGFYTIGSSRIQLLDYLLVLVLLGVSCVPLAHYVAHRVFQRRRRRLAQPRSPDDTQAPHDRSER